MSWKSKPLEEVADFCLGKMLDENKNRGELMPILRTSMFVGGTSISTACARCDLKKENLIDSDLRRATL